MLNKKINLRDHQNIYVCKVEITCSEYCKISINFQLCLLDIFYKSRLTDGDENKIFKKLEASSNVVKLYCWCKQQGISGALYNLNKK